MWHFPFFWQGNMSFEPGRLTRNTAGLATATADKFLDHEDERSRPRADPGRTPLVTVVTAVRDGARYIPDLLASVRWQDYPRIEHIVIDGGSRDGTLEILRKADGITWTSGRDTGMYDAINLGLLAARGEIVAYQNADDRYVLPDAISTAVRYLDEHPDVDAVYGNFAYIDEGGRRLKRRAPVGREYSYRALKRYNFVPAHSTFVRRRVVTERGIWFDPRLQYAGDWDWALRLGRSGVRFGHLGKVLSEFRVHPRSKTSMVSLNSKVAEWRRVCREHDASLSLLLLYECFYGPLMRRLGRVP